jgi:hypothetical protein
MNTNGKSQQVSIEAKSLPDPTACIHCSKRFALAVPIIGAPKDTEYVQLVAQLAQHVMDKHPLMAKKAVEQQLQIGMCVSGLMVLANFESADAGLANWRDRVRFQIHDFSRKNRVSDGTIEKKVGALFGVINFGSVQQQAAIAPSKEDVIKLVKELRDILEEQGPFNPNAPQSAILTL